ncbi:MAG: HAD family hydrolase [Gammaproteobacteria bacterium]|nr:HAD family hydrolase [Gammaproteobacteria bacterium]
MTNNLRALIFDVDGTLADTERDGHRVAFNSAFAAAGLNWEWSVELYGKLLQVTGGKERIRYFLDHFFDNSNQQFQPPEDLDGFIAELHKSKTSFYTDMLSKGAIPLRPGVKRLIMEAREEGVRLAIATTTTPENVSALLEVALAPDAMSWFDVVAAGDIVPAKKPAPDIYEVALQQLGLKPEDCLAFEDSHNGILSSRGAGLETIITINDYTKDHDFADALLVLDQYGEPGHPFTVLEGDIGEHSYLDLALLQELFAKAVF